MSSMNSEEGSTDVTNSRSRAHARAGDVEEMALSVVDLAQVGVVANGLDPLLQRDDLVVARHDDNGAKLQTLRHMHCADRDVVAHRLRMVIEHSMGEAGVSNGSLRTIELRG